MLKLTKKREWNGASGYAAYQSHWMQDCNFSLSVDVDWLNLLVLRWLNYQTANDISIQHNPWPVDINFIGLGDRCLINMIMLPNEY